jgi:hypothetical protein
LLAAPVLADFYIPSYPGWHSNTEGRKSAEVKILAIGQKLFEEKFRPVGFAIKSVGPQGIETEMSITSEVTGFGRAQGVKGTNMGTLRDWRLPNGVATGTGHGIITTTDGDSVVWKLSYAGKAKPAGGEKYVCTVTFMTMSEKLAWLNQTICVMEGEGEADPTKVGTDVFYEWS